MICLIPYGILSAEQERYSGSKGSGAHSQHRRPLDRRSLGRRSGVASVPVVAEAERQFVVVRILGVVVAARLTVVVTLDSRQLLAMFLAVT